jgi:DNA-binding CsgD family transcriptional regulator
LKVSLAEFSRVVALIHEAGAAPERWGEALSGIVGLLEGTRAALMDIDGTNALLRMEHVGHDPANAKLYSEYYFAIDPTREKVVTAPAGKALTVYDNFPRQLRARHEYFEFARRIDIGDVIGIGTEPHGGRRALLSLQRPLDAPGYGAEEKEVLQLLASHVALAKRVQMQLGENWSVRAELEAAFGKLTAPGFIVDRAARIRHVNASGEALMGRCAGMGVRHGKLVFADGKLNAAVHAAVHNAACEHGRSSAVPIPFGKDAGEILVTPLDARHAAAAGRSVPLALVLVAMGPEDERSIAWRMRQLYQLTPAEATISAALALGKSVEEVAKAKRISLATLRSHLRSIFLKTGTRRQAELVRIALRGATVRV